MMKSRILTPDPSSARGFATVTSLHAHTFHSKEYLAFLPGLVARMPVLSGIFEYEMSRSLSDRERRLDFNRTFWRPPLAPAEVLQSERANAAIRLGLDALVSITDHDTIAGPVQLRAAAISPGAPISFEWTVFFRRACFHLGLHNLPFDCAGSIIRECGALTAMPNESWTRELLAWLDDMPGVLVVLNHPYWDGNGVGDQQVATLQALLRQFAPFIHALELNGFRSWTENRAVVDLHLQHELPLVGGGDRHAHAPNALLNLSSARTFDEFAHEVRVDRVTNVLVMPEYFENRIGRTLEAVAEVLRRDDRLSARERWTDRVFVEGEDHGERPVSNLWESSEPAWIRLCVKTACLIGSPVLKAARRLALSPEEAEAL